MVCYHPKQGIFEEKLTPNGKHLIKFSKHLIKNNKHQEVLLIPCGQCQGCRLDKSIEWAVRCLHEKELHEKTSYVTLTYNKENLPKNGSLYYKDFQDFMMRLRSKKRGQTIRMFMCGEYGDKLERPHYHAILFGYNPEDQEPYKDYGNYQLYKSEELRKIWKNGHVTVGEANFSSIAYVARYIFKKVNGTKAKMHYQGKIPEFTQQSRRPGIAGDWYKHYKNDIWATDRDIYKTTEGDYKQVKVSRYFDKMLEKEDPKAHEKIKETRKRTIKDYDRHFKELSKAELQKIKTLKKLYRNFDEID